MIAVVTPAISSTDGDADPDRPERVAADEVLLDDADRDHDLVVGVA